MYISLAKTIDCRQQHRADLFFEFSGRLLEEGLLGLWQLKKSVPHPEKTIAP
jgi:hypothetical protein